MIPSNRRRGRTSCRPRDGARLPRGGFPAARHGRYAHAGKARNQVELSIDQARAKEAKTTRTRPCRSPFTRLHRRPRRLARSPRCAYVPGSRPPSRAMQCSAPSRASSKAHRRRSRTSSRPEILLRVRTNRKQRPGRRQIFRACTLIATRGRGSGRSMRKTFAPRNRFRKPPRRTARPGLASMAVRRRARWKLALDRLGSEKAASRPAFRRARRHLSAADLDFALMIRKARDAGQAARDHEQHARRALQVVQASSLARPRVHQRLRPQQ